MNRNSKRTTILQVACRLVRKLGASHLTLDAVAKEAGVSKGGLLYHFPTKEALIQAAWMTFWTGSIRTRMKKPPATPRLTTGGRRRI